MHIPIEEIRQSLTYLIPEAWLLLGLLIVLCLDMFAGTRKNIYFTTITLVVLGVSTCYLLGALIDRDSLPPRTFMNEMLEQNTAILFSKILLGISGMIGVVFIQISPSSQWLRERGETYILLLAILMGSYFLVASINLFMVFLSLELISIPSYLLVASRFDKKSTEAGIKYLLYGAFATGVMLFGISLLYGLTAGMDLFSDRWIRVFAEVPVFSKWIVLGLVLAALFFKTSLFPFHPWTPDTYEGSGWGVLNILSTVPKIAAFVFLLKLSALFQGFQTYTLLLAVVVTLSLVVGNLSALMQDNTRRLMAYSSIAQSGFIGMAIIGGGDLSQQSTFFYLVVYLFSVPAALAILDYFENLTAGDAVNNFNGLGKQEPVMSIIFVIVMATLIGLPPTGGFFAKLFVFTTVWEQYETIQSPILLGVVGAAVVGTIASVFYYMKVPYALFFKGFENTIILTSKHKSSLLFVSLIMLPVLGLFFAPSWLMDLLKLIVGNI
ncbi:NADH-quinone oxidoreductase subunit N [Cytophaga hutchinsonii]|uniref:NADH-quinone oxidoreductase subunit N n=1 Tax=Cytophaga hutchinsonii (strain ATCC 33406 / DSM 1761 / CIP 103989 / NBRC 15051 / NCIMB 9469 / D465) TaxID=269798 RepID=A0A6N4STU2_CYTH3|nr:NADH-quinone oxidoreductase subunit N [Cytophaga hutchinsonii]ABG59866.1 NADH dehydrogenase subunit N [Cytophaga hutchinsonii ATCC 33406]SFX28476.1 NADH dehydrogenase subunit N [Cytophaga hutchinsonii ATCC 33406]